MEVELRQPDQPVEPMEPVCQKQEEEASTLLEGAGWIQREAVEKLSVLEENAAQGPA